MSAPVDNADAAAAVEPRQDTKVWMKVQDVADYAGYHYNQILLALHEYERTKDTHSPRGLKGFQRKANATWRVHREDVERWMQNLPPTRGVRKFLPA
jgi:hypothetical protein